MSKMSPRRNGSAESRDYNAREVGDAIVEVAFDPKMGPLRIRKLAQEVIGVAGVSSTTQAEEPKQYGSRGAAVANIGPDYVKPRDTGKETGRQEKNE